MKPEESAKDFFAEVMSPVVAAHVEQFVTGNRGLEAELQRRETVWKEHNRRDKAKGDGRVHLGGKAKLGGRSQERAHGLEDGGRFRGGSEGGGGLAEVAKLEKPERKDGDAPGNAAENHDAKNRSERLKAGKMPVRSGWARCLRKRKGEVGGEYCGCDDWRAMPGLHQREQQASGEERPPTREKNARLPELKHTRQKCGGQNKKGYLDTPEKQI
jgi:hypothetical protein